MEATAANKAVIEQMKASAVRRSAKEKTEAEELVTQLNAVELVFERKVGENDHLFGSVTSADIAQQLEAKGFNIDRRKIQLEEPLQVDRRVPRAGEAAPRSHRAHQGHGQGRGSRSGVSLEGSGSWPRRFSGPSPGPVSLPIRGMRR